LGRLFGETLQPTDTPWEYSRRLGLRLKAEASGIATVAHAFARSRYGPSKMADIAGRGELINIWRDLSVQLVKRRFGLKRKE